MNQRMVQQIRVLSKLKRLWLKLGTWRFCQLISNLHGSGPQDIFHTSDDELEEAIDAMLKETEHN